jgi:hypothetical protein
MKVKLLAGLALAAMAAGLAACSEKSALVDRCVRDGEPKTACSCMADWTHAQVDKQTFDAFVLASTDPARGQAAYDKLPPDVKLKGTQVVLAAREQCRDKGAIQPKKSSMPPGGAM